MQLIYTAFLTDVAGTKFGPFKVFPLLILQPMANPRFLKFFMSPLFLAEVRFTINQVDGLKSNDSTFSGVIVQSHFVQPVNSVPKLKKNKDVSFNRHVITVV